MESVIRCRFSADVDFEMSEDEDPQKSLIQLQEGLEVSGDQRTEVLPFIKVPPDTDPSVRVLRSETWLTVLRSAQVMDSLTLFS